jgi:hypothetical protein
LALIAGYLVAIIGYPVGEPVVNKGDEPFPCQHSACGCRTIEQCRQSCCCHSKQQKIAWALERGLDPSRFTILSAAESTKYALEAASRRKASCCVAATPAKHGSCCSTAAKPGPANAGWVVGIRAIDCRGSGMDWVQTGFVAILTDDPLQELDAPSRPAPCFVAQHYAPPLLGRLDRPG